MNARMIAFEMLKNICLDKKYSNLLLRKGLEKAEDKDKGFITQLVYGTLQNYRLTSWQWECYVEKKVNDEVAILLDMSVYQMFFMDKVPPYAILNEAVEITKKKIRSNYANLVNAILRKVERNGLREINGSNMEKLAIETSHPDWIVTMWNAQYGEEITEKICREDLAIKPNAVRVNRIRASVAELMTLEEFEKGKLAEDALWYHGNHFIQSTYYKDGWLSIQDEASQMVAQLLDPQPHEHILDVCSAPGTKSCHIAERMQNTGLVVCGDIHAHRVKLIEEGAQRLGLTILKPLVMDARKLSEIKDAMFDRVLCDVPCSGYGVLARKSDIKFHMQSSDMDTLIPLQKQILHSACQHVKEQGILVYSTCTLNKKENEKQIAQFLLQHNEFELLQQRTIFPYEYESDGFYMAKLRKKKAADIVVR